jgi:hypothetical protein|nr:FG-GAP-like repeat-containing protein [Candidatus Krumholzibacteria bacterium]
MLFLAPKPNYPGPLFARLVWLALLTFLVWAGTAVAGEDPVDEAIAQRLARAEAWRTEQEARPAGMASAYRLDNKGQLLPVEVVGGLPLAGSNDLEWPEVGGEEMEISAVANTVFPRLEITRTGTIYVALLPVIGLYPTFTIYRSDDGGQTFTVWSTWDDAPPVDVGTVGDFIIAEGTVDRAFLVYSTDVPGPRRVRVAWADLTAGPPTWNFVTALEGAGADFGSDMDIVTDAGDYDDYYLYLTAAANDSDGRDIWFTRSTDLGATWEAGYRAVHSISPNDFPFNPRLAYGASDHIHLAYDMRNLPGDPYAVEHRRIGGFAAGGAADWSAPTVLKDYSDGPASSLTGLSATSSSSTVLVQLRDQVNEAFVGRLLWSSDNGVTWPVNSEVSTGISSLDSAPDIDPVTGDVWLLGGDYVQDPWAGSLLSQRTSLANPGDLSAVEAWTARDTTRSKIYYDIDHDSSRGNRRAVVWLDFSPTELKVYFDAEWFRDPGLPNLEPGFPLPVGGIGRTPPAIANVDADPFGEIVFATEEGLLYVVNHDGTFADGWPVDLNEDIAWDAPVAVGDLNGDGEPEIVVGTALGRVFAFRSDGTILPGWPVDLGTGADTFVSIGALGPPSPRSVVVCSGTVLRVYSHDGQDLSPAWGTAVGAYTSPAAIGDVDGDGTAEIVTRQPGSIHVHRLGFNIAQAFRLFSTETLTGMPALADIDENGDLEIAVGTASGKVYVMNHDFTDFAPEFPYDTGNPSQVMGVIFANLLGNTPPELVFSQLDGTTHIVFDDGVPGFNYPKATATNDFVYMPPIVTGVHLTSPDVVVSAGQSLYCWENLGAVPNGWPRFVGDYMEESPAAGDIDLDGNIEIVALGLNELWMFDVGNPPNVGAPNMAWPMYGFDARRSGCLGCEEAALSAVEDPPTPSSSLLAFAPPFPNPASARTALSYALPAAAQVKLQVFDVRGRLVHTLVEGQQEAGHHQVFWNGTHGNGRRAALGLYLARLSVHGPDGPEERVRKIALVR